jgi:predicted CXXCH cytochrome family protein
LWTEATPVADEETLHNSIHWEKGLRCHDCHGGSPTIDEFKNHRDDPTFHSVKPRNKVIEFCGRCHSSIDYMRQYSPSARTDQESEYWTSGHGRKLKASLEGENPMVDTAVATCVDCHGGHGILAVKDPSSKIYPTHVAETCAHCHSDPQRMAGRTYNGHPLGFNQYDQWQHGVHGKALLEKGDLSAPTCNDCHGNHGAMPPGVNSVANACGTCHGKVAKLFAETNMRHKFEEAGLPGCATCHGAHETMQPNDSMLGMQDNAVCARCHNPENPQYGATVAGAKVAEHIYQQLEELKAKIGEAEHKVKEAEVLGMEVRGPAYDLREAFNELTNARTLVHTFQPAPIEEALGAGLKVTATVSELADDALREHTYRRYWLGGSLVLILLVVGLLVMSIRAMPMPEMPAEVSAEKKS